jgi:hypothetical protein
MPVSVAPTSTSGNSHRVSMTPPMIADGASGAQVKAEKPQK